MAATTKVAPWTADQILPLLASSAVAAAQTCVGGADGNQCGTKWTQAGWDGTLGVGQQMSALEVIQSNLIKKVSGPVSNSTGGTSQGNPSAGTGTTVHVKAPHQITTGDKAGAGILTAVVVASLLGGGYVSVPGNGESRLERFANLFAVDVCRLIEVAVLAFFWKMDMKGRNLCSQGIGG
jgi:mannan endo-1,6-alpha-mannosidase